MASDPMSLTEFQDEQLARFDLEQVDFASMMGEFGDTDPGQQDAMPHYVESEHCTSLQATESAFVSSGFFHNGLEDDNLHNKTGSKYNPFSVSLYATGNANTALTPAWGMSNYGPQIPTGNVDVYNVTSTMYPLTIEPQFGLSMTNDLLHSEAPSVMERSNQPHPSAQIPQCFELATAVFSLADNDGKAPYCHDSIGEIDKPLTIEGVDESVRADGNKCKR